jgi:drug/metabolite transporter (DMT)-like permease
MAIAGQKEASIEHLGPFTLNTCRYTLSAILLGLIIPFIQNSNKHNKDDDDDIDEEDNDNYYDDEINDNNSKSNDLQSTSLIERFITSLNENTKLYFCGVTLALLNFTASSFQQIGIAYTSSAESSFYTGFYVVFTPLLQALFPLILLDSKSRNVMKLNVWISVGLSMFGLFIISGSSISEIKIDIGELETLVGAFFWTLHIIFTDIATDHVDPLALTLIQLSGTALISLLFSQTYEYDDWNSNLFDSWKVILFLGIVECVGFTAGAFGQTHSPSHHAAIIYSSETVFATLGGYFFVHEYISIREFIGCILMIFATMISKAEIGVFSNKGKFTV